METEFHFENIPRKQPKQSTEQELEEKRAATAERVRKHREKKRKENNPTARLAHTWQSNFDALPEQERNALLDQAARYKELIQRMGNGDFEAYREVKKFIQETGGTVRHWVPVNCADEVDLEKHSASDPNFIHFGLRTRIWLMFYREYLHRLLINGGLSGYGYKIRETPNVGDAETLQEIKSEYDGLVAHLKEPPIDIPVATGFKKVRTKAEENAHIAWQADRDISQQVFERDYRRYLENQSNDGVDL